MSRTPTVLLVGHDSEAGQHWAWRWADSDGWGPLHRLHRGGACEVRALLASAIPGLARRDSAGPVESLGWLAHPHTEATLATRLGRLLLPPALRKEVIARAQHFGGPVRFRVHPSPSTSTVPWEALAIDDGPDAALRLIEVADVVQVAPLLRRDLGLDPVHHLDGTSGALLVVDPKLSDEGVGRVLTTTARDAWRRELMAQESTLAAGSVFGERYDRRLLSRHLPGRSRFVFVGHVTAEPDDPWRTGLALSCHPKLYATGPANGLRHRSLTALDLIRGTRGIEAALADRTAFRTRFGRDDVDEHTVPARAWDPSARRVLEVDGADLWPMPPRVGIVGCRSGPDLAHPEPSGLVTAVLRAGAEIVIATRWTLYTARTYRDHLQHGMVEDPLAEAARAVDRSLASPAPEKALGAWQRDQLTAWRKTGVLASSPLTWGALSLTDGGRRRLEPAPAATIW